MAFLDDFKFMATDAAQLASKKVNEVYGIAKIKMEIGEKQSNLRNLYKELGEIVYKNIKEQTEDADAVEDKIMEIDYVVEDIANLKKQYREVKKVIICPSCNAEIEESANFCPKCGSEIQ